MVRKDRTPSGSGEVTLTETVLQVLALQPVPMDGGKPIAETVFAIEEGGIEQQAAQQQQDRLLGPAHDQLVHHVAGLMIAAQGVILSESLQACHIPVRVSEFCSVRGYTVLRILKAFEEKKSDVKVSQEEYDEVVAIKPMFLNAMYQ